MKKLKIKLAVVILAVIIGGVIFIIFYFQNTNIPYIVTTSTPTQTASGYSLSEVALHGNPQSCWTAIRGNVYDLTPWINQHPGGAQAILSLCGHDGTEAFISQHNGQRRPEAELQSLLIGKLK